MSKKHYAKDAGAVRNAAKTLLANIRFAGMDAPIQSVVITSAVPDEGKSTVALNLATAIATSGKTALMVECDMRHRTLAGLVGAHAQHGLFSVLSEQVKLADAVLPLRPEGLSLLDAEPSIPSPSDMLASKRFQKLHAQLKDAYDYVIFDTPPVGAFVDAAVLASQADGTILVVREGYARRENVVTAYDQLKKAGANVIGACMNYVNYSGSAYSYYGYGRYGYGYGKGKGGGDKAVPSEVRPQQGQADAQRTTPTAGTPEQQGRRFSK